MKNAIIVTALVVITLAVVVPFTQGLQCYFCISGDGLKDSPGYHKKCKEGDLPDSIAQTCSMSNTLDLKTRQPYNASYVETMTKQGISYGCGKFYGKADGEELSVKGCSFAATNSQDACASGSEDGVKGSICICHSDKCNSAVGLSGNSIAFVSVIISALSFRVRF